MGVTVGRNDDWAGLDDGAWRRLAARDLDALEKRVIALEDRVVNQIREFEEKVDQRLGRITGVLIGLLSTVAGAAILIAIQLGVGK